MEETFTISLNSSLLKSNINSLNKDKIKLTLQKSWPWATLKWGREKKTKGRREEVKGERNKGNLERRIWK
jgi:hypothetical protein